MGPGAIVRSLVGGAAFLIGIVILVIGLGSVVYIAFNCGSFNSGFRDWHTPVALSLIGMAMMVVTIVLLSEPAAPRGRVSGWS